MFYLVGKKMDRTFRILKISKQQHSESYDVIEVSADETVYSERQKNIILETLASANRHSGFINLGSFHALLGLIKFKLGYYLVLVSSITISGRICV